MRIVSTLFALAFFLSQLIITQVRELKLHDYSVWDLVMLKLKLYSFQIPVTTLITSASTFSV